MTRNLIAIPHLLTLFLLCNILIYGQTAERDYKTVSGTVTLENVRLFEVNISVQNSNRGTKTDSKGYYEINVRTGETIVYSYIGMQTMEILVEDVTSRLNIKMIEKPDELGTVLIDGINTSETETDMLSAMDINLETATGRINPARLATTVHYLNNREIKNLPNTSLILALSGRYSGLYIGEDNLGQQRLKYNGTSLKFDIDGLQYETDPGINFNEIEHLYIIKTLAIVIVRTKNSIEVRNQRKKFLNEKIKNHNFYNNDAINIAENINTDTQRNKLIKRQEQNHVKGKITHLNSPIPNVTVKIKSTNKGTRSDADGLYNIKTNPGEIIEFSHIAYKSVSILVEDVTEIINIKMVSKTNKLDEVTVTAKNKLGKVHQRALQADEVFSTSRGNINPKTAGFGVSYLNGDDIVPSSTNILDVLTGKFAGVMVNPVTKEISITRGGSITQAAPPIWDIDNQIFTQSASLGIDGITSLIDVNDIKDIHILKGLASTNKYGILGRGGVIVVRTKSGSFDGKDKRNSQLANKYKNTNYYSEDAVSFKGGSDISDYYLEELKEFDNKYEAYAQYSKTIQGQVADYSVHIEVANLFAYYFNDDNLAKQVLKSQELKHANNAEILKAIAYHYQAIGLNREAINTYQSIYYLRPKYAQSYRDIANAYIENEQFKRGWRMYMKYLLEGNEIVNEGVGPMIFNEMEYLYFNRSNQTEIKENFKPNSKSKINFRNDVRLVFEWNTSEAEFDLEFVNPELRSYVFEHSLSANEALIIDEKTKGYSSKEFLLDDIGTGEWLVNLTYLGNKKPEPTYLKLSTYYNWGKPNQRCNISVYALNVENQKFQLLKLNKQSLVVMQ